jgi:hypothetical protein
MQQMGFIPRTDGTQRGAAFAVHMKPPRDAGGTRRRSYRLSHSPGRPCTRYLQPGDSSRQQRNERVRAGVRLPHSSNVSGRTLSFAPDLRAGFLAGQRNPTT